MHQEPIIWKGKRPEIIKYNSQEYVVSCFYNSTEHKSLYAVARDAESKFRMIEVHDGQVKVMEDYVFDDIYVYCRDRYYSRDRFNLGHPTELDGERIFIPFCFVNKGLNGLLTCYPVCFNSTIIYSGKSPLVFCPSFVCESFSDEYYYLNGCVYRHDMMTGYTGKGWYKEIHRELQFYGPKPSCRNISCYQYERDLNSSMGVWRVVDEDGTDEKISIDQIEASSIIFADFRDRNAILVGVELEGDYGPEELLVYEYKDGPILRDSIYCFRWDIYDMQKDTLIVIQTGQNIQLYSKKKGFLSHFLYDYYPFYGDDLEGREFILTPSGLNKGERDGILRISHLGELTFEENGD